MDRERAYRPRTGSEFRVPRFEMDELSALFCEDVEADSIQEVVFDAASSQVTVSTSTASESASGGHAVQERTACFAVLGDDQGWDEVDGPSKLSLHNLIQRRKLLPSELKRGLVKYREEWKDQIDEVDQSTGLAPIHHIAIHVGTYTNLLLLNFLTYGNADVDAKAMDGKTALMLAVEADNIPLMKALVALGANVNADIDGVTVLKLALEKSGRFEESTDHVHSTDSRGFETTIQPGDVVELASNGIGEEKTHEDMSDLLKSVGATSHCDVINGTSECVGMATCKYQPDHNELAQRYKELNDTLQSKRHQYQQTQNPAIACDALKVLQEVEAYCKTYGSRILCLDGGGIRGLMQILVLRQIEHETGKKIIDLFDWIVGTSTGGIIALALVYAKMSIKELQRFYLRLKRDVFSRSGILAKGSSKQLEWYLQKQLKGTMDEVSHPKVLVSAVSQSKSGIDLRFFNNCFEDDFSREKVWRVARYTSAAPLYFTAKDGYLDGGLLSDNPAEDALTAIQQFYRKRRLQLPISLVVSIGSGVNPVEPRKCVNITTELWNLPSQLFPFMKILGEALMNHQADQNCSSCCNEQGITYIRLNPQLNEEIDSAETDNDKLLSMLWTTRQYLHSTWDENNTRKMEILSKSLLHSCKK